MRVWQDRIFNVCKNRFGKHFGSFGGPILAPKTVKIGPAMQPKNGPNFGTIFWNQVERAGRGGGPGLKA